MKKSKLTGRGRLLFHVLGLLWYPVILLVASSRLNGGSLEGIGTTVVILLAAGELAIAASAFFGWRKFRKKQDEEQGD